MACVVCLEHWNEQNPIISFNPSHCECTWPVHQDCLDKLRRQQGDKCVICRKTPHNLETANPVVTSETNNDPDPIPMGHLGFSIYILAALAVLLFMMNGGADESKEAQTVVLMSALFGGSYGMRLNLFSVVRTPFYNKLASLSPFIACFIVILSGLILTIDKAVASYLSTIALSILEGISYMYVMYYQCCLIED